MLYRFLVCNFTNKIYLFYNKNHLQQSFIHNKYLLQFIKYSASRNKTKCEEDIF